MEIPSLSDVYYETKILRYLTHNREIMREVFLVSKFSHLIIDDVVTISFNEVYHANLNKKVVYMFIEFISEASDFYTPHQEFNTDIVIFFENHNVPNVPFVLENFCMDAVFGEFYENDKWKFTLDMRGNYWGSFKHYDFINSE